MERRGGSYISHTVIPLPHWRCGLITITPDMYYLLTCDCGGPWQQLSYCIHSRHFKILELTASELCKLIQSICRFPIVGGRNASAYAALLRNGARSLGFEALSPSNFLFLVGNQYEIPESAYSCETFGLLPSRQAELLKDLLSSCC